MPVLTHGRASRRPVPTCARCHATHRTTTRTRPAETVPPRLPGGLREHLPPRPRGRRGGDHGAPGALDRRPGRGRRGRACGGCATRCGGTGSRPRPAATTGRTPTRCSSTCAARGLDPVVDLLHHTSYPEWLDDGFRDRRFAGAYLRFATAVAERYPWLTSYTLVNEPFATLFLAGHEALWPPYDRGAGGVRPPAALGPARDERGGRGVAGAPAAGASTSGSTRASTTAAPRAARPGTPRTANDRRHVVLDLALGQHLDPDRPFLGRAAAGRRRGPARAAAPAGRRPRARLLQPLRVVVRRGRRTRPLAAPARVRGAGPAVRRPLRPAAHAHRDQRPRAALGPGDVVALHARAVPGGRGQRRAPRGLLLVPAPSTPATGTPCSRVRAGRPDPVGRAEPARPTAAARGRSSPTAWEAAVAGTPPEDLPAYRFQPPCDRELAGLRGPAGPLALAGPPGRGGAPGDLRPGPPRAAAAGPRLALPDTPHRPSPMERGAP